MNSTLNINQNILYFIWIFLSDNWKKYFVFINIDTKIIAILIVLARMNIIQERVIHKTNILFLIFKNRKTKMFRQDKELNIWLLQVALYIFSYLTSAYPLTLNLIRACHGCTQHTWGQNFQTLTWIILYEMSTPLPHKWGRVLNWRVDSNSMKTK